MLQGLDQPRNLSDLPHVLCFSNNAAPFELLTALILLIRWLCCRVYMSRTSLVVWQVGARGVLVDQTPPATNKFNTVLLISPQLSTQLLAFNCFSPLSSSLGVFLLFDLDLALGRRDLRTNFVGSRHAASYTPVDVGRRDLLFVEPKRVLLMKLNANTRDNL